MKGMQLKGILPALVTPLQADNRTVNTDAVCKLISSQLKAGANGFYVLGGTGEGLALGRETREVMCESAIKQVAGQKPVIIHVTNMDVKETIAFAQYAERAGADAIASVPPFFFAYRPEDIYLYYKKLAESVSIPLIIYYHPAAQKEMKAEQIARLFEIDNITGVKWSSGNYYEMMRLKDITNGEMNVINGPDEMLLCGLAAGADAGIGSTYNVMLREFVEIYELFHAGKWKEAQAIQYKVNRVIAEMLDFGVIPGVKSALKRSGIDVGNASFPMRQPTQKEEEKFWEKLQAVDFPFLGDK